MRIVIVDTTLNGKVIGGAQTFLPGLISGLISARDEIDLVTAGSPNNKVADALANPELNLITDVIGRSKIVEDAAPILASWVNKSSPDLFLISVSPDIGWVTLPHLNPSIATVSIGHTDSETFYLPVRHYRPFLTRAIGVSEQVCSSFVNDCNLDPDSVDFIPYGVERREEKPPENEEDMLKLVYVGRLEEEQKRVSDIVAIAKRLSDAGVDYRLSIVGDGEEMPMMRQELSNETANGKVVFHGWLDGDAVRAELCSSDVFLLTSAYEGFCISLIEALANGCCPIVTDIRSGNSQLIESGDNGFIVPIGDVDAFVEKIRFLDRDRMALIRMREKAWETGKQYGIDGMVERYRACFEKAVEQVKIEPKNIDPEYPLMETCRSRYPMWLRKLKKRAISITK